jgi:hypothetical protein
MTEVEKRIREMLSEARGATQSGEPNWKNRYNRYKDDEWVQGFLNDSSTYWYNRGIEGCCEKLLGVLSADRKRDERIKTDALAILEELEVISD